jgi:trans-aconitate methyltransferase
VEQTPVHEIHNPDLLAIIPTSSLRLVEVGCSSGALAREFKRISPKCDYLGIEVDPSYTELAQRYCDRSITLDIESADDEFWVRNADRDCWIFGDTLEHLKDPWKILRRIRERIPSNGVVVACVPNAQHWSLQVRLSIGAFRYEKSGLLDQTHLRWFTRQTLLEMFDQTGFEIIEGYPRIFEEPQREIFLPAIENMARLAGGNPAMAVSDSLPLQYIVKAAPK